MRILSLAFAAIFTSGCAVFAQTNNADWLKKYEPTASDVFRNHSFGIKVYNHSGKEMSKAEWQSAFIAIDEAYRNLQECIGFDDAFSQKLKNRFSYIVIVPPEIIIIPNVSDKATAFINKQFRWEISAALSFRLYFEIFVRRDDVSEATFRHEFAHAYIFWKKHEKGGGPNHPHINPIFCSCVNRAFCGLP